MSKLTNFNRERQLFADLEKENLRLNKGYQEYLKETQPTTPPTSPPQSPSSPPSPSLSSPSPSSSPSPPPSPTPTSSLSPSASPSPGDGGGEEREKSKPMKFVPALTDGTQPTLAKKSGRVLKRTWAERRRREKGTPVFRAAITHREFYKFLGILLATADNSSKRFTDYWARPWGDDSKKRKWFDLPQASFPRVRQAMSRQRFFIINRAMHFSEAQTLELEKCINERMGELWVPSNYVVLDESMVAFKGRKNPHHVFIPRKPHPHGIKNWSVVDFSGYLLSFSRYCRVDVEGDKVDSEPVVDTVDRMVGHLPENTVVLCDSYFGSVVCMKRLAEKGIHCLFSCNKSRPAYLFKDMLCASLEKDGDDKSCYGVVAWKGEEGEVPFIANAFQSKNRKLCTLSTLIGADKTLKEVDILVNDRSAEETQQVR